MTAADLFLFLLLLGANGAPIATRHLLGERWRWPLDGGRLFVDQKPLFGSSKTVSGVVVAILTCVFLALLFGYGWRAGFLVGSFAMLGDLFSSFIKRRMGMQPSAPALLLDQVPESLFPLLAIAPLFELSWMKLVLLMLAFVIASFLLSRLAYHLGIRRHPY
ncbi:CDP-archaeol synthase [Solemya velum gill symbiont]|uniref:Putative integral membrane protein n=1 Tax=Solemya velum gill symbiont TaxID=2340 RepID=A0A0B0HB01_SOVGS|nr:CDP-archaeol synthase [Solemya velum gill symbiont]KHF25049.1 putative integral membrane protein [Solemya velum gill symbiont]